MRIALTKKLEKSPTQRKKRKKRFSIWTFEATSGSPSLQIWYSEMSDVAHVAGYSSQLGFVLHVFFIFHMEYDEYELYNARTSFLSTFDFLWVFDCLRSAPRGSFCVFVWRVQPWSLQEQWRTMGADTGSHLCTFFFYEVGHTLWQKQTLFLSKGHFFSTRRSTTDLVQTLPTFLRIMLLLRYAVACHEWGPFMRRLWAIEASNSLGWIGFFPNDLHYIDMLDVW